MLNFWATWCPPCVEEMPSLVQMQKKFQSKDVIVLAVSVDDDPDAYHKFLKDHAIDLLTVRDPGGPKTDQGVNAPVASRYGTFKFPETYIIDRSGIIRRKFIGAIRLEPARDRRIFKRPAKLALRYPPPQPRIQTETHNLQVHSGTQEAAMIDRKITLPDMILFAGTRVALGGGIGMLVSKSLTNDTRKATGLALTAGLLLLSL